MSQGWPFAPTPEGRTRRSLVVALAVLALACATGARAQEPSPAASPSPYIGADACKACHATIYESWSKTKHARAGNRVRDEDLESGACLGCHATGSAAQLNQERLKPSLPGVQCECCHGPARAHAASEPGKPPVMTGLTRHPQAGECERCHNPRGPHFQGFVFTAMKALVHAREK
jgi:hypothetical protein